MMGGGTREPATLQSNEPAFDSDNLLLNVSLPLWGSGCDSGCKLQHDTSCRGREERFSGRFDVTV